MNTDAAGVTPEPGTTPEPDGAGDDKGDALAALLAAGAEDMSEPENDGEGRKSTKRSRPGSEEQQVRRAGPARGVVLAAARVRCMACICWRDNLPFAFFYVLVFYVYAGGTICRLPFSMSWFEQSQSCSASPGLLKTAAHVTSAGCVCAESRTKLFAALSCSVDHCWLQGDDDESRDYSNCRPLHTQPNALLAAAAAAASADGDGAEALLGSDWRKQHVLYGNDNHYMFFRCATAVLAQQPGCCCWHSVLVVCVCVRALVGGCRRRPDAALVA